AHFHDFWDIVPQHVLNAHLQGRGGGGAAGTGALHAQVDDTSLKPMEHDVAAVLSDRGAHPRVEQFLDLRGDFVSLAMIGVAVISGADEEGLTGDEMLHDDPEDARLQEEPFPRLVLADRDEVASEEDAGDTVDLKQAARQGRTLGLFLRRKAGGAFRHNRTAGQELESRRVRRLLGLNKHGRAPVVLPVTFQLERWARNGGGSSARWCLRFLLFASLKILRRCLRRKGCPARSSPESAACRSSFPS